MRPDRRPPVANGSSSAPAAWVPQRPGCSSSRPLFLGDHFLRAQGETKVNAFFYRILFSRETADKCGNGTFFLRLVFPRVDRARLVDHCHELA